MSGAPVFGNPRNRAIPGDYRRFGFASPANGAMVGDPHISKQPIEAVRATRDETATFIDQFFADMTAASDGRLSEAIAGASAIATLFENPMNHYSVKIHVRPELRYSSLLGGTNLSEALARTLGGVIVSQWQSAPTGGDHLRLEFSRPSRKELLAEVQTAAVQAGYALVEAEVEEFVDKAVTGAIVGFCGTGGAAGLTTRNPLLTLIAAAIGGYVGERAGASARTLIASHRYQLHQSGRWIAATTRVIAPGQPAPQPDLAAAAFFPA